MRIEHIAMYVNDLEAARDFFVRYLGGQSNDGYHNPKYMEQAAKSGWIVKFLRLVGVLQVSGSIILGATVGGPFIALWLSQMGIMSQEAAGASAILLALLDEFCERSGCHSVH